LGHPHVHDHDVGPQDRGHAGRLLAVGRLTDDLEVGLGPDQLSHAGAHQRLVVGDQDLDRHAGLGRNALTTKPWWHRPAANSPPSNLTRSPTPASPIATAGGRAAPSTVSAAGSQACLAVSTRAGTSSSRGCCDGSRLAARPGSPWFAVSVCRIRRTIALS